MYRGIAKINKYAKRILSALVPLCLSALLPLCLGAVLLCPGAMCYTLTNTELNKIIYNKINSDTKKELGNVEYKLNIQGVINQDIITDDTTAPKVEITGANSFSPVSFKRVTIKNSKGAIVKSFPLTIQTLIYQNVLTASDTIPYNGEITLKNTVIEKKEVSKYYNKVLLELPENAVSSKNIVKNSIILKSSVKQKALVEKNQDVDIVFEGRGIQVTLRGRALKEGALGDNILVRSDKYNKTYNAIVNSNSKVTVRI
ncbi:flagellar basal body P-ring formation protein FlgA [bacterium]|nr:flagellar basal body P-ring formation protein FlgA [bacterium]